MKLAILALAALALPASADVRLYRTSVAIPGLLPIATFDSPEGPEYNMANCWIVRDLMQGQPGVKVQYVCVEE